MKIVDGIVLNFRRAVKPHDVRRRWLIGYAALLVIMFAGLTIFRFYLFGTNAYWSGLVDKMSSGVLISLIAASVLFIVVPPISYAEDLSKIDAWNIGPTLNSPLKHTREYWFRGRSGRWFRTRAIPRLTENARRNQTQCLVHMILPDPEDTLVLDTYARYRNSISRGDLDRWTSARIRNEIFATLLAAGKASSDTQFFKPDVALLKEFSLFRTDLSDDGLVMTREDPRWPGWHSSSGTKFYDSVKEDLRMAKDRGRPIDLAVASWPPKLSAGDITPLLAQLGFNITLTPAECEEIIAIVNSKENPYD